jgi:hypothetical protein
MQIRIASFSGMQPNTDARLLPNGGAQVAHNCLLTDGSLQALPQWGQLYPHAFSVGPPQSNTAFTPFSGYFGLSFFGQPFGSVTLSLDTTGVLYPIIPSAASASVSFAPAYLSKKAVSRAYGVTTLALVGGVVYESPIVLANGSEPSQVLFEGDYATVSAAGNGNGINIYRSTSDVTTGSGANGAVIANWQLVAQLNGTSGIYVDGGVPTDTPYDTYLPRGHTAPPYTGVAMGLLEGGWVWVVSSIGGVALSDRFSWGYWPVENQYGLGAQSSTHGVVVTGAVSVGNRIYIGTQVGVFVGNATMTEEGGVVLTLIPVPNAEACVQNTMVATSSGAMYCSTNGIVSLNGEEATMLTRGFARGVAGILPDGTELRFDQMRNAIYHNGRYCAFRATSK